jgi:hypothetical protein
MRYKLLNITIATTLGMVMSSCGVKRSIERGVVVYKQEFPKESVLFVNLIQKNKTKQKPLAVSPKDIFSADRKLSFSDSTYMKLYDYAFVGDTISFRNMPRVTYVEVDKNDIIRNINRVPEHDIIDMTAQKQR